MLESIVGGTKNAVRQVVGNSRKYIASTLAAGALAIGSYASAQDLPAPSTPASGKMGLTTYLANTNLVAGSTNTLYVLADSRAVPTQKLMSMTWDVVFPTNFTILSAQLPSLANPSTNPADYYSTFNMDGTMNRVDSTPTLVGGYNEFDTNDRLVSSATGPTNRWGILGSWTFVVPNNAVGQTGTLSANDIVFRNSANTIISSSSAGTDNAVFDGTFTPYDVIAVPEPSAFTLVLAGLGLAGVLGYHRRKRN